MRRTLLVSLAVGLLGLVAYGCGSSSGNPAPGPEAGTDCLLDQVGDFVCGTADEQEAVLRCHSYQGLGIWVASELCAPGAACVNNDCRVPAGLDTGFDVGDGASLDAPADGLGDGGLTDSPQVDVDSGLLCDPGTRICLGQTVMGVCLQSGQSYRSEDCPEGLFCTSGVCKDKVCTPGDPEGICVGPAMFSRCNGTGTDWEWAECEAGYSCYQGGCVNYKCPPGATICKGFYAVQECQPTENNSYDWVVTDDCSDGVCRDGKCLSACEVDLKEDSYLGCEYWAVDLDNVEGGQYQLVALVVSVPTGGGSATVTVTDMSLVPPRALTPEELVVTDLTVSEGGLKVFILPGGRDIDGTIHSNRSFRVSSTAPVTVHQFNPLNGDNVFTNDASLLLPSNGGGQEYYALSWPMREDADATLRGFLTIVATQAGLTKVSVTPTAPIVAGVNVPGMAGNPAEPYLFFLEQGDVLNLETDGQHGADLSGTRVISDKKINVFGGHECANIPLYPAVVNYCDHIEQQLIPLTTWGNHYISDAFFPRNGSQLDTWRVLSGANGTNVNLVPPLAGPFKNLKKGQWVEFQTAQSFEVNSNNPILVGHYMQGSNYAGHDNACGTTGIGDPAMTLVVPVQQYMQEYVFLIPSTYQQDYLNVIKKKGSTVLLDGNQVNQPFTAVGIDGAWLVAQVPVADGTHKITGSEAFGITAYGYDCDVSYAYPGGLSLKSVQE